MKHIFLVAVTMLLLTATAANAQLSPVEQSRFDQLKNTPVKEWKNVDTAAYLALRERDNSRPEEAITLGATALKFIGTELHQDMEFRGRDYGRISPSLFFHKTVCMTYARDWNEFMAYMAIMQFNDGQVRRSNAIERDVFGWKDNYSLYFDNVTPTLGVPTATIDIAWDKTFLKEVLNEVGEDTDFSKDKTYIEHSTIVGAQLKDLGPALPNLKAGDIVLTWTSDHNSKTNSVSFVLDRQPGDTKVPTVYAGVYGEIKTWNVQGMIDNFSGPVIVIRAKEDTQRKLAAKVTEVLAPLVMRTPEALDKWNRPLVNLENNYWFGQPGRIMLPVAASRVVPKP